MTETTFTPGPWEAVRGGTGTINDLKGDWVYHQFNIYAADKFVVAEISSYSHGADTARCGYPRATTPEQASANARLIAHAPELVEALEAALLWMEHIPLEVGTLLPSENNEALEKVFGDGMAVLNAVRGASE